MQLSPSFPVFAALRCFEAFVDDMTRKQDQRRKGPSIRCQENSSKSEIEGDLVIGYIMTRLLSSFSKTGNDRRKSSMLRRFTFISLPIKTQESPAHVQEFQ